MARTTEYAQDKLEQLLALAYGDVTSDTRVVSSHRRRRQRARRGGSSDPAAPVDVYVDYLDVDGALLPSVRRRRARRLVLQARLAGGDRCPSANLKQITVTAIVKNAVGSVGRIPQSTVAALKTFPF